jgi:pimeloyl-ACP methyl ester carboxylesterase
MSNEPMQLKSPDLRDTSKVSANWPDGRQMAPDRTGTVRGLTRRSFHRIAFTDWGPASAARPVVCLHGLTRNGRDFDHLAAALVDERRRVICPDLPGRGQSERLHDSSDYVLPQYCSDMTVLMAALGATELDWIGTSLGGASRDGSGCASGQPDPSYRDQRYRTLFALGRIASSRRESQRCAKIL